MSHEVKQNLSLHRLECKVYLNRLKHHQASALQMKTKQFSLITELFRRNSGDAEDVSRISKIQKPNGNSFFCNHQLVGLESFPL